MMGKSVIFLVMVLVLSCEGSGWNDELCDRQLEYFRNSIRNPREDWAIKMFDLWAKMQSGLSIGNTRNFGHFDECVKFRHSSSNGGEIQGQYCMITHTADPSQNDSSNWNDVFDWREVGRFIQARGINLQSGICVPASCSADKTIEFASSFLTTAGMTATNARCQTEPDFELTGFDIFVIILFSLFGLTILSSTTYDIYMEKKKTNPNKLLSSFSIYTNGSDLFNMEKNKSKSSINSIHGIRALSVLWVVLGHRRFFHLIFPSTNPLHMNIWLQNIRTVIFQTDHLAVDTFFVMGGLLMMISFLNDLDKKRVSLWQMYFKRYLRYTPVLAAIILFHLTLFKFTVSGPNFNLNTENCQSNWWGALLHIQNYLDFTKMCVGHSWYLSADFQLFLVSPLFIFLTWKFGYKFLWILPAISLGTVIYVAIVAFNNGVPVFYLRLNPDTSEIFHRFIYFPTHARMGPWFIGMATGYIIHRYRDEKLKLSKTFYNIMWIVAISTLCAVILGFYPFMQMNNNNTTILANAIYLGTFRNAFACGMAWLIFACHNGTGLVVRWFLSLPQWQPISRMGLSIYLIHPIYQSIVINGQNQVIHFDEISLIHAYLGDIVASITLAAVLYLTFEIPFLNIVNYFSKRKQAQN